MYTAIHTATRIYLPRDWICAIIMCYIHVLFSTYIWMLTQKNICGFCDMWNDSGIYAGLDHGFPEIVKYSASRWIKFLPSTQKHLFYLPEFQQDWLQSADQSSSCTHSLAANKPTCNERVWASFICFSSSSVNLGPDSFTFLPTPPDMANIKHKTLYVNLPMFYYNWP